MIRHPERYEKWAEVMKQQEASGLSVTAYCRQEEIKVWQLYDWRRRVRDRDESNGSFVPLSFREESDSVASGVAVVVGRVRLELSAEFDESELTLRCCRSAALGPVGRLSPSVGLVESAAC